MPVAASQDVAAEAAPVCGQCGTVLTPGKRFCKQCGYAVNAPAASTVFEQPPSAPATVEMPAPAARYSAPMAADHAPTVVMEVPRPERFKQESLSASNWEPVKGTAPPLPATSAAISAPASGDSSKEKIVWAVGLAAVLLLVAGGGWALYAYMHRSVFSGAESSAQTQQSTAQTPVQEQASAAQPAKPPAGASLVAVPEAPQNQFQPAPASAPSLPIPAQSTNNSGHGSPAAPTPVFHLPPASPSTTLPAQVAGHSGVRHYQGPPVPHGGTVVFDNMPKARLKFTFDHAAWQLTIKPNPDGTKKVILSSMAQGYQSSCDLGWEIVE